MNDNNFYDFVIVDMDELYNDLLNGNVSDERIKPTVGHVDLVRLFYVNVPLNLNLFRARYDEGLCNSRPLYT